MNPYIGQKVILNTLRRPGDFPGEITTVMPLWGVCTVKLECQDNPVQFVLFYRTRPLEVDGSCWNICYPDVVH